ncbi:MAG TPA: PLP-dependent aminotransferase family protein [Symbiobacteriaceae bacterium]|nr:PLP-dependent aminotransferase family protein [Symbiobacteriaceae bacterium]
MKLARWMQNAKPSFIREILKFTQMPDVISFAGGMPAPELFPVDEMSEVMVQAMKESGQYIMQYAPSEGDPLLRKTLAERLTADRNPAGPDDILLVNGSQHALDLLAKAFIDPGDAVLVENPTYLGALQAFRPYAPNIIPVPTDEEGMVPEHLEALIAKEHPKFVYVMPTFQNPRGTTMSLRRREQLVSICKQADVPIVEDDPYGELRYRGERLPHLRSMWDQAIYLGTFSKIMSPGLRLGWVVAPPAILNAFKLGIQATSLNISPMTQRIAALMMNRPTFDQHLDRLRKFYAERMFAMLECLNDFPEGTTWSPADGGLFVWVTLPGGIRTFDLVQYALDRKVAFVPGEPFFAGEGGESSMRLNFSNSTPEQIRTGMARLKDAIESMMLVHK